jgi:hypothetical protein
MLWQSLKGLVALPFVNSNLIFHLLFVAYGQCKTIKEGKKTKKESGVSIFG